MIKLPLLRFGERYDSLELDTLTHFSTGEPIAEVGQANAGLVARDLLRKMPRARAALREIPPADLLRMSREAADLYRDAALEIGGVEQTLDAFIRCQSATTGLPQNMCRANVDKLHGVLSRTEQILASLLRGLDLDILASGFGAENGVPVSWQANTPALGLVLPSNSPGVHGLWLPVLALQVGLVLKPGSSEPWTPWRMTQALLGAGMPAEAIAIYTGGHDIGQTILDHVPRSLIFGSAETVARHAGNPRVSVHGPGFSKIILGEDQVDDWERHLDLMVKSVLVNGGRSCINASSIWAPRHTEEIAAALAERLAPIAPRPLDDPEAALAAFTNKAIAQAIDGDIEACAGAPGVEDVTAARRDGERLVEEERCAYLRPTVLHVADAGAEAANKEYLFPFASVVACPQKDLLKKIGPTLVATALTDDAALRRDLLDAPQIDRLNFGPIATTDINWLQPHEGNIIDSLYRARAFQQAPA